MGFTSSKSLILKTIGLVMKSYLLIALFSLGTCFGAALDIIGDAPHAFVLPKGQVEGTFRLHKINDTLDLFNIKDRLGVANGTAGDMNGHSFGFRFGLSDKYTVLFDQYKRDYDYGRSKLGVHTQELALRTQWDRFTDRGVPVAFQLSYRKNRGSGLSRRFSALTVNNATFNFNPPVELDFSGISDTETGFSVIASKQLRSNLVGSVFAGIYSGDVSSGLSSTFPVPELQTLLDALSYSQTKKELGYSLHYDLNSRNSLVFDYHYYLLKRSKDVSDPVRPNEVINAAYQYKATHNSFLTLSARYMKNQFIGDHNFLYNKLVASRSKKQYGYLTLGYTFRYGYGK